MITEQFEVKEFEGRARLSNDSQDVDISVDFVLWRSSSGLYFSITAYGKDDGQWLCSITNSGTTSSLFGKLADGREVRCQCGGLSSDNILSRNSDTQGTVLPLSDVIIGTETDSCVAVEVHLQGSLGVNTQVSLDKFCVSIASDVITTRDKYLYSKDHLLFLATTTVRIESNLKSKAEFLKFYESLIRILCLGLARSISVRCYKFYNADGTSFEQWQEQTGYGLGSRPVVLESCIAQYIQECVTNYEALGVKAQEKIHLASAYLTMSENGFSDLQSLQVIQAWELYARWENNVPNNENVGKEDDSWIDELIKELKVYRRKVLLKKYPQMKSNPDVWDRIVKFVRRVNFSDPLKNLVENSGLKAEILGLDLESHVSLANSVRHSGAMVSEKSIWELKRIIDASRLALRLILLKEIGYTGFVQLDNGEEFIRKDSIFSLFNCAADLSPNK